LWLASKEHDLQAGKEFRLNHPELIPQFLPGIPCYRASYSERIGTVVGHAAPFRRWANHLRVAYFGGADIPTWTIDHPYENPIGVIRSGLPPAGDRPRYDPISWRSRRIPRQDFPWVELPTSLQWRFFREAVAVLRRRGNRVFVVVGPFNEHMLEERSLETYGQRKRQIEAWLREEKTPHYVPPALPSEQYADASHPLPDGYRALAGQLLDNEPFLRLDARDRRKGRAR